MPTPRIAGVRAPALEAAHAPLLDQPRAPLQRQGPHRLGAHRTPPIPLGGPGRRAVNQEKGANLRTSRAKFDDFKLHMESTAPNTATAASTCGDATKFRSAPKAAPALPRMGAIYSYCRARRRHAQDARRQVEVFDITLVGRTSRCVRDGTSSRRCRTSRHHRRRARQPRRRTRAVLPPGRPRRRHAVPEHHGRGAPLNRRTN